MCVCASARGVPEHRQVLLGCFQPVFCRDDLGTLILIDLYVTAGSKPSLARSGGAPSGFGPKGHPIRPCFLPLFRKMHVSLEGVRCCLLESICAKPTASLAKAG